MSKYTEEEKAVGRQFRETAQAALLASFDTGPPNYVVPNFIALYRHNCDARGGRSTALNLKEIYQFSPADAGVPAGRFGFIYKAGRCAYCGQTARSRAGRLVDAHERPPLASR